MCAYCDGPITNRGRKYCLPRCANKATATSRVTSHGVSGYRRRDCRCDECVRAWQMYQQRRRERQTAARRGLPPPPDPRLQLVAVWIPDQPTPCLSDPETWFPDRADSEQARQAAALCAGCPVRVACDLYAHETRPTAGVWAGVLWHVKGKTRVRGKEQ